MYKPNFKKISGIVLKFLFWVTVSAIGFLVLAWILIRNQTVQDYARGKVVIFLNQKLGTKVAIDGLSIDFPNRIIIKNFYFEDRQKDTLIFGERLLVDISMLGLLTNRLSISNLELENVNANIQRNNLDTLFNFEYLANAYETKAEKTKKINDSSAPMIFQVGSLRLKNIQFRFKDQMNGIDSRFFFGFIRTTIKKIDLTASKYETGPIEIDKISLVYTNTSAALAANAAMNHLKLHAGELNLHHLLIPIYQLQIDTGAIAVRLTKQNKQVVRSQLNKVDTAAVTFWKLFANNIIFKNISIQFDDDEHLPKKNGLDYSHLKLEGVNLQANSLDLSASEYKGLIQQLHFKEKSGFAIEEFSTRFSYNNREAYFKDFHLKTNKTHLQTSISLNYESPESLTQRLGECLIDLNLKDSKLAISDLLLVAPDLKTQLTKQQYVNIGAGAIIKGKISDLNIVDFHANVFEKTTIQFKGRIKGLPNVNQVYFQLPSLGVSTTRKDLLALLSSKIISNRIRIPESMLLSGSFNGNTQEFRTKLTAKTSLGNLQVNGLMSLKKNTYNALINLSAMEVGKILKQDAIMGRLTLQATIQGKGFDYQTSKVDLNTTVQELQIKGYSYKNLVTNFSSDHGNAHMAAVYSDPNLQFNLHARAVLKKGYPALQLDLLLDTMNFNKLHLTEDSFSVHSKLKLDFSNTHPDSLIGEAFVSQIRFSRGKQHFSSDTARIKAEMINSDNHLTLFSEPLNAAIKGRYRLTELPLALQHHFNQYYQIKDFKDVFFVPQDWGANFKFRILPIVLQFLPELKGTDSIVAVMHFISARNILNFNLNTPLVAYDGNKISKLAVKVNTDDTAIQYELSLENAAIKSLLLNNATINGRVAQNKIYGNMIFRNKLSEKIYQLSMSMQPQNKGLKFHLNPDSLLLNKQSWQVDPLNSIYYDSAGIIANNVGLQFNDQSISINSSHSNSTSPIELSFKNFSIRTLTDMIRQDSIGAEGVINGQAFIMQASPKPMFTSDIRIVGLAFQKKLIGDLNLKVANETANSYKADIVLNGVGTHASLKGFYNPGAAILDMQLLMDSLNMSSIIPFAKGQIKDAGGKLQANLHLTGNINKPSLNGDLRFDNAFITPSMLGQKFKLENEKLLLSNNVLTFDHLTLKDSLGKTAILNGTVQTTDLRHFNLDLSLEAEDFNLVNSTQADNQLFFGKLNLDATIKLKGDLENLEMNAKLKANKLTDLNLLLPSSDPELQSREGVVKFIDTQHLHDSAIQVDFSDTLIQRLSLMKGII